MMERFKLYLDEGIVSSVAAFTFIKKLTTSFENWEEFKNGIIDKDGKIINRTKKIPIFNGIARKIKILFQRFVPNKKYLALLLTMYLLKKESVSDPLENLVKEELDQKLTLEEKVVLIDILTEITTSKDAGDYPKPFFVGNTRIFISSAHIFNNVNPDTALPLTQDEMDKLGYDVYKDYPNCKDWKGFLKKLIE